MNINNIEAGLKDIKVTTKGVNVTLEDVRLDGEELTELASLIGGRIRFTVETPQMSIFDDEDVNELPEPLEFDEEGEKEGDDENMDEGSADEEGDALLAEYPEGEEPPQYDEEAVAKALELEN